MTKHTWIVYDSFRKIAIDLNEVTEIAIDKSDYYRS